MRWLDWLRLVLSSVSASPLKSLLTALGIAIGIAAVTLLTSLGEGVRHYVLDNFSQFGTRIIAISPGKTETSGMGSLISSVRLLTMDDLRLLENLPGAEHVVANVQGSGPIRHGEKVRNTTIYGTTPSMVKAWDFKVASGRFLPDNHRQNSPAYAVLGHKVKSELFATSNPLGEIIRVGGQRYRVIGVMQEKGSMLGFDLDDMVYIPADRALSLFDREGLMEIDVVFSAATTSDRMASLIKQRLIARHGQEDFTLVTQDEMLASLNRILSMLTLGIAALGSISLIVGGVGIFTVMTTNLAERIPEIGLLRAIGTSRRQLLGIFVGEAIALSLLGGLAGMGFALLVLGILSIALPEFPMTPNVIYLFSALISSVIIGLIAGIRPAWQASKLSPVVALRDE
ncbi:ABC transporter permease [Thalassolituus oleivorans]|uniref:ABC transporter permease n=1 Tax=Thalassolituus oleivorans TaxID=187493 RepID=UPI001CE2C637|nr:ABC transporter permease [Thalassolituus oleivorans]MCA6128995.1 peptide ABC transporter permease [Thalassolituus oleivorans 4BN06-13]